MRLVTGILSTLLIVSNVALNCIPLFLMGIVRVSARLLGKKELEQKIARSMDLVIDSYVVINRFVFSRLNLSQVRIQWTGDEDLSKDNWYMVVSNHQSWSDIVILQTELFKRIPPLKFFTKQQLIWVPFLGQAMWLLDFPYVKRMDRKKIEANPELLAVDQQATRQACEIIKNHPTSVLNFLEGTRNTAEKYAAQETPRFKNLLNPKTGGLTQVLAAMDEQIHTLIDITIEYPRSEPGTTAPTFWEFMQGQCAEVNLRVKCRLIPDSIRQAENDAVRRQAVNQWIELLWKEKDTALSAARQIASVDRNVATGR